MLTILRALTAKYRRAYAALIAATEPDGQGHTYGCARTFYRVPNDQGRAR